MRKKNTPQRSGFTIVELLIVIVVVAILTAITIVAYNGIQERARASEASSALTQAVKKIKLWQVDNPSTTPASLLAAGVSDMSTVTFQYKPGTNGSYCITATTGTVSYKITDTTSPEKGGCTGHGQGGIPPITNLATNPSFELNAGWPSNNNATYPVDVESTIARTGSRSRTGWNTNGSNVLLSIYSAGASDSIGIPVTEGGAYTFSCYFRAEVPHTSYIRGAYRVGSTYTSTPSSSSVTGTAGQWTRVSHTFTVPEGVDRLRMVVDVSSTSTQPMGTRGYIDDAMLVKSSTATTYADGSSLNWEWNGATHASSSTGPAL